MYGIFDIREDSSNDIVDLNMFLWAYNNCKSIMREIMRAMICPRDDIQNTLSIATDTIISIPQWLSYA